MKAATKRKIKGAVKSKTMVANGVMVAASVTDMVLGNAGVITAMLPGVAPYMAVVGVANMVLRWMTEQPLEFKADS